MNQKKKPALTKQAWLSELGRRLAWTFPIAQVKDILSDYQEQFDEGHSHCKTEAEIIEGLGTPAEAVALLLEEEPSARASRLRYNVIWGAALAVCLAFWWICFASPSFGLFWMGTLFFHPAAMSVLFMLLRGPSRMALDQKQISKTAPYYLPAALTLVGLLEKLILPQYSEHLYQQYITAQITEEAFEQAAHVIRYGNAFLWIGLIGLTALLGLWLLVRSARTSIRYFPGVIHTFGALEFVLFSFSYFSSMDIDSEWERIINIPMSLLPYFAGLITAIVFQRWVDGRKSLPRIFQGGAVTWQDWRHRLGVSLLGWFSVEQTLEIMEDYQEQYELGREQGKTEDQLISEMGRPETVVRDLLAEDRKARLNHRKNWPWVVLAAVAGWLLLGLLRSFEFGGAGFGLYYHNHALPIGILSVVLGTISLFILLRARERAAVERRYSPARTHLAWIYLPPLAFSALVTGLSLWTIYSAFSTDGVPCFFGLPLTTYIIISIEFAVLLLTLLLIWTLARCVSGSIQHLPAVPLIAGSIAAVLCAGLFLTSMDMEYTITSRGMVRAAKDFLTGVRPCLLGLLLAVISWLVLRFAGKKEG